MTFARSHSIFLLEVAMFSGGSLLFWGCHDVHGCFWQAFWWICLALRRWWLKLESWQHKLPNWFAGTLERQRKAATWWKVQSINRQWNISMFFLHNCFKNTTGEMFDQMCLSQDWWPGHGAATDQTEKKNFRVRVSRVVVNGILGSCWYSFYLVSQKAAGRGRELPGIR